MKAAFETLVDAGYQAEVAYLVCVQELKQIVNLVYQHGPSGMRQMISATAEYGDYTRRTTDRHGRDEGGNGADSRGNPRRPLRPRVARRGPIRRPRVRGLANGSKRIRSRRRAATCTAHALARRRD